METDFLIYWLRIRHVTGVSLSFTGHDGEFTEAGACPFHVGREPTGVVAADFDGDETWTLRLPIPLVMACLT